MLCTDCYFKTKDWKIMLKHYKEKHPHVRDPSKLFTYEARHRLD